MGFSIPSWFKKLVPYVTPGLRACCCQLPGLWLAATPRCSKSPPNACQGRVHGIGYGRDMVICGGCLF